MRFYLGTHETSWLTFAEFPLFVSHRRLAQRRRLPTAACDWALDSGGFTELSLYGGWRTTEAEYVDAVGRYREQIGRLEWCAPMDWMCEPAMLARTGLSVPEHQERTVESYLSLRGQVREVVPVLQGWTLAEYLACVELYAQAGVDLTAQPTVGIGSVCRRQATREIADIAFAVADRGIRLHGFGVKASGLQLYAEALASADSLAWSYNARRRPPLPGCSHAHCANCIRWARRWRTRTLRQAAAVQLRLPVVDARHRPVLHLEEPL